MRIVFYSPSANETHFRKERFTFGPILKIRVFFNLDCNLTERLVACYCTKQTINIFVE